jgi:hypothetical protein
LALQLAFVGWIVYALVNSSSQARKACGTDLLAQTCRDAYKVGSGLGVVVIVALWVAVDVIVGMTYLVWKQKV